MKKFLLVLMFFPGLFLLNACAPKAVVSPQWLYEKDALKLTLQADPELNMYNNEAHTLQLCIYQLKEPNGFNQLTQSEDGLYTLLGCTMFDGSVANYQSFIISPGKQQTIMIDRAEGAKYIGLAAGYADIQKDRVTRLIDIPVVVVKEGGVFRKQMVAKPDSLNAVLRLGPHQIETGTGD